MKRYLSLFLALLLPFIARAEATNSPFTENESAVRMADAGTGGGNESDARVQNLEAEHIIELDPLQTAIAVRSNAQEAEVYLNREYHGLTPLTISGLTPGVYELHVKKDGFTDCTYLIYLAEGCSYSYFVPLKRNTGFFDLSALPQGAEISVDSEPVTGTYIEKDEGWHEVRVRKFGYKDASGRVFLKARTVKSLSVNMTQEEFRIQSFEVSKDAFNPRYAGSLGECVFSIAVSAPEKGELIIKSSDETEICRIPTGEFSTWEQRIRWNGRKTGGQLLPEGVYTVELSAGGQSASVSVGIYYYSLFYRLADISSGGLGIGRVPAAFSLPASTTLLSGNGEALFRTDGGFYTAPISLAMAFVPTSVLELSAHCSLHLSDEPAHISAGGALKVSHEQPLGINLNFCIGGAARYGFSMEAKKHIPATGVDTGSGLGAAFMFGLDNETFYAGLTSSITLGAETGNLYYKEAVWRKAAAVSIMPTEEVAYSAWFAVDSAINYFPKSKERIPVAFGHAFDTGVGAAFMLPTTSAMFTFSLSALIFRSAVPAYVGGSVGIMYMF